MIKKLVIVPLLLLFMMIGSVHAQSNDLPEPGMLPGNSFYFIKNWSENIRGFFLFDESDKAEHLLNLSEIRLSEAKQLIEENNLALAEKTLNRYQAQLNKALSKTEESRTAGRDVDEVLSQVSKATLKHQAVLLDVYDKVPEQARPAIKQAMEQSLRGHETALGAVSGEKQQEILQDVENGRSTLRQKMDELRDRGIDVPSKEEIEQRMPTQLEIDRPDIPAQPGQGQELEPGEFRSEEREIPVKMNGDTMMDAERSEVETQMLEDVDRPETPARP